MESRRVKRAVSEEELEKLDALRQAVGGLYRREGDGIDWTWALAGSLPTTDLATGAFRKAYTPVVHNMMRGTATPDHQTVMEALQRLAGKKGVDVMTPADFADRFLPEPSASSSWLSKWIHRANRRNLERSPGFYSPSNKAIAVSSKSTSPGFLAHELGHALQGDGLRRGYSLGMFAPSAGAFGALASRDEDVSRTMALAGSALSAGTLVNEFDASARGASLLKRLGVRRSRRLAPFVGFPTYLFQSALPLVAHYGKKFYGGFDSDN